MANKAFTEKGLDDSLEGKYLCRPLYLTENGGCFARERLEADSGDGI